MYQHSRLKTNRLGFFQKFKNFDYILLFCIIILGFISLVTMYSTDGGQVLFHTKSHFTKLIVFTIMMLIISFINIKYWFALGYISYLVVIGLLVWTYLFGMSSFSKYAFKTIFLSFTIVGTSMNLESVINFSDSMIFAMSIPNIIGLYFLSSQLKSDILKLKES